METRCKRHARVISTFHHLFRNDLTVMKIVMKMTMDLSKMYGWSLTNFHFTLRYLKVDALHLVDLLRIPTLKSEVAFFRFSNDCPLIVQSFMFTFLHL